MRNSLWLNVSTLIACTAASLVLTSCTNKEPWADMATEDIPSLMRAEFDVEEGMSRETVEHVLGAPTDIGRTKEGYPFAQYKEGLIVRSVVYDFNDVVLSAYPK